MYLPQHYRQEHIRKYNHGIYAVDNTKPKNPGVNAGITNNNNHGSITHIN